MNVANSPNLNLERLQELLNSGAFDHLVGGAPSSSDSPSGSDGYDRGASNDTPFLRSQPRKPPLTLGAEADSAAVTALARAMKDPALVEAIFSGNKGKVIRAVDAAGAKAAEEFFKTMGVEPQAAIKSILRQIIRRATFEIAAGKDPMAALAKSLEVTRNFTNSDVDPASVREKPAVDFSPAHSIDKEANTAALQSLASILSGDREIEVGDKKGKLGELLAEAREANDREAYIASIEASAQLVLAELEAAGLLPEDEAEAENTAVALRQMLFAATAWQGQGHDVAGALSLAMNDSGHFPLDEPTGSDDVEETDPPVVFDDALSLGVENNQLVIDTLAELIGGKVQITVNGETGTLRELMVAAAASGNREQYVQAVVAAAAVAVEALDDSMPSGADGVREIERALHQVLFAASGHLGGGASAEDALAKALEESGHFSE